jgi:hypothetical protein
MKHVKLYEDFVNEPVLNEGKNVDPAKIKAEYEKKIVALEKKADKHYSKEEDVPLEDIQDILIPLLREIMNKKIEHAGLEDEKAKKNAESEIKKLEQKYEKETQNYEDDVDRERMGRY